MNYKFLIFIISYCLLSSIATFASDYTDLRDSGISAMLKGNFQEARFKFDGAEGCAVGNEKDEIRGYQNTLIDSINNAFNFANSIKSKNGERAILIFEKLYDKRGVPMHQNLNANLGWTYGNLKMKSKERHLYEEGVRFGESLSALYLARLIQANRESISTDSLLSLYLKARNYYAAMDSIGTIYVRKNKVKDAYDWFAESNTDYSKYHRAVILLDSNKKSLIDNKFKSDNPIELLSEICSVYDLSRAKKSNADALYFLGMLYYYAEPGDPVKRDRVLGKSLIWKASEFGHPRAKQIKWSL